MNKIQEQSYFKYLILAAIAFLVAYPHLGATNYMLHLFILFFFFQNSLKSRRKRRKSVISEIRLQYLDPDWIRHGPVALRVFND